MHSEANRREKEDFRQVSYVRWRMHTFMTQHRSGPKPVRLFTQKDPIDLNNDGEVNSNTANESKEKDLVDDNNPF